MASKSRFPSNFNAMYASVTTHKNRGQSKLQCDRMINRFPGCLVFHDIASTFDFERPGFLELMELVLQGRIAKLAIERSFEAGV